MKAIYLNIKGKWGHFRKVETNNNPLSHDFITKTALIGMMGAVIGIERKEMRQLFPKFSEGIKYSLSLNSDVVKQTWGFTLRKIKTHDKSPSAYEFLKNPNFNVLLSLIDDELNPFFEDFLFKIKNNKACYTPVLGLHNCPAELYFLDEGTVELKSGSYETKGFVVLDENSMDEKIFSTFSGRIGFEKIPSFQNNDFWNLPDKYKEVIYPDTNNTLEVKNGKYHEFKGQKNHLIWSMI